MVQQQQTYDLTHIRTQAQQPLTMKPRYFAVEGLCPRDQTSQLPTLARPGSVKQKLPEKRVSRYTQQHQAQVRSSPWHHFQDSHFRMASSFAEHCHRPRKSCHGKAGSTGDCIWRWCVPLRPEGVAWASLHGCQLLSGTMDFLIFLI